jgi:hypothetical protein
VLQQLSFLLLFSSFPLQFVVSILQFLRSLFYNLPQPVMILPWLLPILRHQCLSLSSLELAFAHVSTKLQAFCFEEMI